MLEFILDPKVLSEQVIRIGLSATEGILLILIEQIF